MSKVFERFVEKTPVSVMARAAMEHALAPQAPDALFVERADKRYIRELLFSSVVDLMGVVVSKKVQDEVSGYYIANEVRATTSGMEIAVEPVAWEVFQTIAPVALAREMLIWAAHVQLRKLKRHPRGVKNPVPKRARYANETHVSTARLLAKSRETPP